MDLFDLPDPPSTHAHDPDTSREAIDSHEASGARTRNQRLVLFLVKDHPGLTAVELWSVASESVKEKLSDYYEIRRRLCDLESKGLVLKGKARKCRIKNTTQTTWEPYQP